MATATGVVATHYADSDGVSIAYQVHGDGPINIVFVPGFVSHVDLFWEEPHAARLIRRLTSFARLVVDGRSVCGDEGRGLHTGHHLRNL